MKHLSFTGNTFFFSILDLLIYNNSSVCLIPLSYPFSQVWWYLVLHFHKLLMECKIDLLVSYATVKVKWQNLVDTLFQRGPGLDLLNLSVSCIIRCDKKSLSLQPEQDRGNFLSGATDLLVFNCKSFYDWSGWGGKNFFGSRSIVL